MNVTIQIQTLSGAIKPRLIVAWMERSEIRDFGLLSSSIPDSAALHPGYHFLSWTLKFELPANAGIQVIINSFWMPIFGNSELANVQ